MPWKKPPAARMRCWLTTVLCTLSLLGCAAKSTVYQDVSAQLPTPPLPSTPLPPQTYSISASERIETWRLKLTDTQLMSAP